MQMATVAVSLAFFAYIIYKSTQATPYRSLISIIGAYTVSMVSVLLSLVGAIVLPNLVAILFVQGISRPMVWYSREWYGLFVYSPIALAGSLGVQLLVASAPFLPRHPDPEYGMFNSVAMLFTIVTFFLTHAGLASSFVGWIYTIILTGVAAINEFILAPSSSPSHFANKHGDTKPLYVFTPARVSLWAYTLSISITSLLYTDMFLALIDLFIPLTGRMGIYAPVDHIVAFIFGMMVFMGAPHLLAFAHSFGRPVLARVVALALMVQVLMVILAAVTGGTSGGLLFPFDKMHPKRAYVECFEGEGEI